MNNQRNNVTKHYNGGNQNQEVRKGHLVLASPIPQHAQKKNPFQKFVEEQRDESKNLLVSESLRK